MLYKRYAGSFVNCKGQTWRVEIWQAADVPFSTIADLTFDADTPLEIEWEEREKYETTCGATLTINVVSPADRTFTDLFQVAPGSVMAHVYLDNALFWVGGLDCETYEEPYQSAKDYTVTLTFTDFGHMQRIKYAEASGLKSVRHYIDYCLAQVGLSSVPVVVLTSLKQAQQSYDTLQKPCNLDAVLVDAANFYDEDGEASTLDEVLDGVLQPIALRIVQRAGKVVVYDLNALRTTPPLTGQIVWDATEQTLSVDKLAQTAVIKFSPYAVSNVYGDDSVTLDEDKLKADKPADRLFNKIAVDSYEIDRIFHTTDAHGAQGIAEKHPDAHFFKMEQMAKGGEVCEGLAWLAITDMFPRSNLTLNGEHSPWPKDGHDMYAATDSTILTRAFNDLTGKCDEVLMRMPRVWVPATQLSGSGNLLREYLKLTLEMMIDPRLNPFAEANDSTNEKDTFNWCKVRQAYTYIPFSLVLFDNDGKAIYQYVAKDAKTRGQAYWKVIDYTDTKYFTHNPSYLLYFANSDKNSFKEESGVQGWSKNRTHLFDKDLNADLYPTEGELIPLPPRPGYLELTIYTGCIMFDDTDGDSKHGIISPLTCQLDTSLADPDGARKVCISTQTTMRGRKMNWAQRWWLYKWPKLEIVKGTQAASVNNDDVEYSAWVNASAKDEIKLDTICGTLCGETSRAARGVYKQYYNGEYTSKVSEPCYLRRSNTAAPWIIEYDLLGLLFSQYGHRVPTLEGEAITPLAPLQLFTDRAMPETSLFMIKSEVLSAYDGTSDIKFVRLEPEEWTKEIIK